MRYNVKKLFNLVPRYGWIMIACSLIINVLTYNGTRLIVANSPKHDLSLCLDTLIPLRTEWVIIYLLAYVQWAIGFLAAASERKSLCYRILGGEIVAKLLCMACYIILPVTIIRPEIIGNAPWDKITRLVYFIDAPESLFPSIHCLESYICFRGAMLSKKMPRWYMWVTGGFALLVFASTVLIKQHFLVDIIAGVLVGEIGLQVSGFIIRKKDKMRKCKI